MGRIATVALCALVVAGLAAADWNEGDYYKMHYPQLPKVDGGWDVKASYYKFLADDWQCSETGPVTDIHLWVSFENDVVVDPNQIHLAIWTDDPVGNGGIVGEDPNNTYSMPLEREWHYDLASGWTTRLYDTGYQGWYDPETGTRDPNVPLDASHYDHQNVYQINVLIDPVDAYVQEVGNIYWLEVSFKPNESMIGWKESGSAQYRDDAVWRLADPADWYPLTNPDSGLSMDLAFVITPEPTTIALLLLGLAGLVLKRR